MPKSTSVRMAVCRQDMLYKDYTEVTPSLLHAACGLYYESIGKST